MYFFFTFTFTKTLWCFIFPFGWLAEWSAYEVRLMFAIIRSDSNNTELYTARDIAHKWVTQTYKNTDIANLIVTSDLEML